MLFGAVKISEVVKLTVNCVSNNKRELAIKAAVESQETVFQKGSEGGEGVADITKAAEPESGETPVSTIE